MNERRKAEKRVYERVMYIVYTLRQGKPGSFLSHCIASCQNNKYDAYIPLLIFALSLPNSHNTTYTI